VFNGDIGVVLPPARGAGAEGTGAIGPGARSTRGTGLISTVLKDTRLRAYFLNGDQLRSVAVSRLANVETAFAMTVHKSQGSEFDHTVLVLAAHSGSVLTRELIYTGITRARQAFSLFAERPGLLESGIARATRRESGLPDRLYA